ncbi:hypothetical protein OC846_001219 [Tilletia horrida]|uniref:Uncharacterized protein n=1 Tax=Tilletia horrida TaxID=155126 RepID=A0AAN6GUE7_9BASI|nr:hypothetical protein OC845_000249 [Tilletia horrida]KAK0556395.1 hypothetical protein OC846_001219 [Tilletia horrida]KAK0569295.1 hypothetical protein OC861_001111 [Tilletia horrida]
MGQPATAAIIVACIFLAIGTIYFSYRLYLKVYHRGARKLANSQIEQQTYHNPLSPNGGSPQEEYPPSAPVASSYRQRYHQQQQYRSTPVSFQAPQQQPYRKALAAPSSPLDSSGSSSPRGGDDTEPITPPLPAHTPAASSAFGSNSSTSAIQRQYAAAKHYGTSPNGTLTPSALAALASANGQQQPAATNAAGASSVYGGSDQGLGGTGANSAPGSTLGVHSTSSNMYGQRFKRDSYLPHLNRDNIQIVTPSPLGFGLGGMATATDQRTLAFSKASSIGENRSLLSDPLLSATIAAPGSAVPAPDGTATPAMNGNNEWGQRVQAYRNAGTDASSSSHHHGRGQSVSSIGPAPGPSTDTPAAEYLAQQKRELKLKTDQPRQPQPIAPPSSTSEQQRLGTLPPSQQQAAQSRLQQQAAPASHTSSSAGPPQSRRFSGTGQAPPSSYRAPSHGPAPINTTTGASTAPTVGRISESDSTGSVSRPTLHRKQSAEERRLSALTARQSPLQRMSSGELWTDARSAPSPVP